MHLHRPYLNNLHEVLFHELWLYECDVIMNGSSPAGQSDRAGAVYFKSMEEPHERKRIDQQQIWEMGMEHDLLHGSSLLLLVRHRIRRTQCVSRRIRRASRM